MNLVALTQLARTLTRDQFLLRVQGIYLAVAAGHEGVASAFRTEVLRVEVLRGNAEPRANSTSEVHEIAKAKGNPYPERISVGRARNCDIVLRDPSVSKLHAHFLVKSPGVFNLVDLESHNGTRVNGLRAAPQEVVPVARGDVVQFGGVSGTLVDAAALFALLA